MCSIVKSCFSKVFCIRVISVLYLSCFSEQVALLSDAEGGEDGCEDFGGGDFAGDFAEVVEGVADVLCHEVGGDSVTEGVECLFETFARLERKRVMALVCEEYLRFVVILFGGESKDGIEEVTNVVRVLGTDRQR